MMKGSSWFSIQGVRGGGVDGGLERLHGCAKGFGQAGDKYKEVACDPKRSSQLNGFRLRLAESSVAGFEH